MPTWREVVAHLKGRHQLAAETAGWIGLVWDVGSDGRVVLQRTKIEAIDAYGQPWLLIMAEVCREKDCDPALALRRAARIGYGAFAFDHDHLIVRHSAPLGTLALDDLEVALVACAREAARMRAETAAPHSSRLYESFSD